MHMNHRVRAVDARHTVHFFALCHKCYQWSLLMLLAECVRAGGVTTITSVDRDTLAAAVNTEIAGKSSAQQPRTDATEVSIWYT